MDIPSHHAQSGRPAARSRFGASSEETDARGRLGGDGHGTRDEPERYEDPDQPVTVRPAAPRTVRGVGAE